jgi:hypothetical protein
VATCRRLDLDFSKIGRRISDGIAAVTGRYRWGCRLWDLISPFHPGSEHPTFENSFFLQKNRVNIGDPEIVDILSRGLAGNELLASLLTIPRKTIPQPVPLTD